MPEKIIKSAHLSRKGSERNGVRKPRSQERSREDFVHRLRSMLWFAAVKNRYGGHTTSAMDVDLLALADASGRVMWRIKRHASDPGQARSELLARRSPVDVIGERPNFHHTKVIYNSELFTEVLAARPLGVARRDALIKIVLERLGLYEPSQSEVEMLERSGIVIPRLRKSIHCLRAWLAVFSRKRHIDRVLLLCLLYMRALAKADLDEAAMFRDAVLFAIDRFCARPGFDQDVITLWRFIITRRVFTNQMSLDHSDVVLTAAEELVPMWVQPRTAAEKKQFEWKRYLIACSFEQDEKHTTFITERTPVINAHLSSMKSLETRLLNAGPVRIWTRTRFAR